jgi:hypothetical protein
MRYIPSCALIVSICDCKLRRLALAVTRQISKSTILPPMFAPPCETGSQYLSGSDTLSATSFSTVRVSFPSLVSMPTLPVATPFLHK